MEDKKEKKKKKKSKDKDSDAEDNSNGDKNDMANESESTVRHRNVAKKNNEDDR